MTKTNFFSSEKCLPTASKTKGSSTERSNWTTVLTSEPLHLIAQQKQALELQFNAKSERRKRSTNSVEQLNNYRQCWTAISRF